MKGLITLIKLHKRTLDDLRRGMVALETQKSQLQQVIVSLQQELQKEIVLAANQPDMAHFFGDFAKRIQGRQEEVRGEIRALEQKMAKLQQEISEAFAELKKFEIALEAAKRRAREEAARKEGLMMDEIAEQQYQRRKEES